MRTYDAVLERLRAEFMEMPGLRLTREQVQRLCGVEERVCQVVLDALVDAKFLCLKSDGVYGRLTDGAIARPALSEGEVGWTRQSAETSLRWLAGEARHRSGTTVT